MLCMSTMLEHQINEVLHPAAMPFFGERTMTGRG